MDPITLGIIIGIGLIAAGCTDQSLPEDPNKRIPSPDDLNMAPKPDLAPHDGAPADLYIPPDMTTPDFLQPPDLIVPPVLVDKLLFDDGAGAIAKDTSGYGNDAQVTLPSMWISWNGFPQAAMLYGHHDPKEFATQKESNKPWDLDGQPVTVYTDFLIHSLTNKAMPLWIYIDKNNQPQDELYIDPADNKLSVWANACGRIASSKAVMVPGKDNNDLIKGYKVTFIGGQPALSFNGVQQDIKPCNLANFTAGGKFVFLNSDDSGMSLEASDLAINLFLAYRGIN